MFQVALLRWVQRNIHKFGGDSDRVTLFGQGSGAACVTYHAVSPMSKGLFHRAIAQSGASARDVALPKDQAHTTSKSIYLGI